MASTSTKKNCCNEYSAAQEHNNYVHTLACSSFSRLCSFDSGFFRRVNDSWILFSSFATCIWRSFHSAISSRDLDKRYHVIAIISARDQASKLTRRFLRRGGGWFCGHQDTKGPIEQLVVAAESVASNCDRKKCSNHVLTRLVQHLQSYVRHKIGRETHM